MTCYKQCNKNSKSKNSNALSTKQVNSIKFYHNSSLRFSLVLPGEMACKLYYKLKHKINSSFIQVKRNRYCTHLVHNNNKKRYSRKCKLTFLKILNFLHNRKKYFSDWEKWGSKSFSPKVKVDKQDYEEIKLLIYSLNILNGESRFQYSTLAVKKKFR